MITIRQAYLADIDRIMPLYERAKRYMQLSGNPNQWIDGYPARNDIKADIEAHHCFVVCDDVEILAAFAYIEGHDPTYDHIDGAWLNDKPYAVVHRLASSGKRNAIGRLCLQWALDKCGNLRVDTHADNLTMQHILASMGFTYTGIIRCHNGTPRLAYHLIK